jgi:hypothetical protein
MTDTESPSPKSDPNFTGWIQTLFIFHCFFIPFFIWVLSFNQIGTTVTVIISWLSIIIATANYFGLFPFFQDLLSKDWLGIILRSAKRIPNFVAKRPYPVRQILSKRPLISVLAIAAVVLVAVLAFIVLRDDPPPSQTNTTDTPISTPKYTWSITLPAGMSSTFVAEGTYDPEALGENTLWVIIKPSQGRYYPQPESCHSISTAVRLDSSNATWSAMLSMEYVGQTSAINYEFQLYMADTATNGRLEELLTSWCQRNNFSGAISVLQQGLSERPLAAILVVP